MSALCWLHWKLADPLLALIFGLFLDLGKFRLWTDPYPTSLRSINVAAAKVMAKNAASASRSG